MTKATKCSPEVRERAVRMVQEHRGEYPSLWAAIELIAPKIGCVPKPCMNGFANRKSTPACARARPARSAIALKPWGAKSRNCGGPTRS